MSQKVIPGQYISLVYKLDESTNKPIKYIPGKGTTISNIETQGKSIPVIVATIIGTVHISDLKKLPHPEPQDGEATPEKPPIKEEEEIQTKCISVISPNATITEDLSNPQSISINLPKENDIVLVKVLRISSKQVYCEIIAVESKGPILADSGIGSTGTLAHQSIPPGGNSQHLFNLSTIASANSGPNAQIGDLGENFRGVIRSQDIRATERDKVKVVECFKPGDIVRAMIISLGDGNNYYLSTARNDLGVVFAKSCGGAGGLMYPVDWMHMIDVKTGLVEMRKNANPFV
ncbi:CSL4 [[Candida] subhashii]|uniref:CSL4 n=1 Tax=[Candida] subhashii TaxID=561895 RepID=A0A8J5QHI7_9ASCO|nr:CSL4 [[Candida] subhashii]KAG7661301.1 CSL4 [[Candida] subhashii]